MKICPECRQPLAVTACMRVSGLLDRNGRPCFTAGKSVEHESLMVRHAAHTKCRWTWPDKRYTKLAALPDAPPTPGPLRELVREHLTVGRECNLVALREQLVERGARVSGSNPLTADLGRERIAVFWELRPGVGNPVAEVRRLVHTYIGPLREGRRRRVA